jgi:hypothetical protein
MCALMIYNIVGAINVFTYIEKKNELTLINRKSIMYNVKIYLMFK